VVVEREGLGAVCTCRSEWVLGRREVGEHTMWGVTRKDASEDSGIVIE